MKRFGFLSFLTAIMLGSALMGASQVWAADDSSHITQKEYLQWLVRLHGDESILPAKPTADDYLKWARDNKVEPKDGWKLNELLTREVFAETLAQVFGVPTDGGATAALAKEGVTIPSENLVARPAMMKAIDDFGFQSKVARLSTTAGTPIGPRERVAICHRGRTIVVASPAVQAHLNHGDYLGACR